ncbi:LPS export ABC transporter permease LptG [bacterium]|nr:LPS export ABC transporter permease LptG [bacterium]
MRAPQRLPTLDRFIAVNVLQSFGFALAALTAVFLVINATEELQRVGAGQYRVRQALWFVLLTLPNELCALFPAAAVLGNAIGLGGLAHRSELIAIAAAGVSRARVLWSALRVVLGLAAVGLVVNEFIAAPLTYRAHIGRSVALSDGRLFSGAGGFWTRAGSSYVNLRTVLPDGSVRDVYVYDFDAQHRMRRLIYARKATYADHAWRLEDLRDQTIGDAGVTTEEVASLPLAIDLTPRQLGLMRVPPDQLSLADIWRGIAAARRQGESATALWLALWQRSVAPVVILVMSLLAVALILAMPRGTTLGRRVFVGGLLGIGFQMFNQTFATFGLVYGLAPWLSATLPTALAFGVACWCVARSPL